MTKHYTGAAVIEQFEKHWPYVHKSFGKNFPSLDHFLLILEGTHWIKLGRDDNFILIEETEDAYELHWFCPNGANIDHIRSMLDHAFSKFRVDVILGNTPSDHPSNRKAKTLARAIGAERVNADWYILTKPRFYAYNGDKIPTQG